MKPYSLHNKSRQNGQAYYSNCSQNTEINFVIICAHTLSKDGTTMLLSNDPVCKLVVFLTKSVSFGSAATSSASD